MYLQENKKTNINISTSSIEQFHIKICH